jgi:hypothetical protein
LKLLALLAANDGVHVDKSDDMKIIPDVAIPTYVLISELYAMDANAAGTGELGSALLGGFGETDGPPGIVVVVVDVVGVTCWAITGDEPEPPPHANNMDVSVSARNK